MLTTDRMVQFWPLRKASSALFHWRTTAWRRHPSFRSGLADGEAGAPALDRPVFLLGTQNGGLTLLSRILHRHRDAISVSGDYRYWAGEDEAQDALADILPEDFGWRRIDLPGFPSRNHGWVYASADFLPYYRRTAADARPAAAARYRRILRAIIAQQGKGRAVRFIDKSQSLTVRIGAVQAALADCSPRFVLVSRDPFAVIWSQATRNGVVKALDRPMEDRVRLCADHWANSFSAALEDAEADPGIALRHWRFEDILADPSGRVAEICEFAGMTWDPEILPGPDDRFPWGSRTDAYNRRKWYPLRTNVNDSHRAALPDWATEIIAETCAPLIERFGYHRPD